ncbi:MAG: zinc-dependent alcohol dehydrogenase family protein [Cyclobacteriaceae bacterium]|nr:zinc-dependent alcohol dehydrogenase family protein [Cyclobacteriaceae bacterium]
MNAWQLQRTSDLSKEIRPLVRVDVPVPLPGPHQLLIQVSCCGICHTELDEIEGRTPPPSYPVIPGHQVVGRVHEMGPGVSRFHVGDRVGVAWIFSACGKCEYCLRGQENLCSEFKATGRDADGGYAEFMVVPEKFASTIPSVFSDTEAAPLLCAGAIGYRSLKLTQLHDGEVLGLTGFGASAHLVLKMARHIYPHSKILVFARSREEQEFARSLGAYWAGGTADQPPCHAHAIIDTTPAWLPIVNALSCLHPGGRLVINAIRKESSDKEALLNLDYPQHLWMEKEIKSVANITVSDVREFLDLAAAATIRPKVELYPFEKANEALIELKQRHVTGAKVLVVKED